MVLVWGSEVSSGSQFSFHCMDSESQTRAIGLSIKEPSGLFVVWFVCIFETVSSFGALVLLELAV